MAAGTEWPLNFGWTSTRATSRSRTTRPGEGEFVGPVAVYAHDLGCSITGGFVYRGADLPACGAATSTATTAPG